MSRLARFRDDHGGRAAQTYTGGGGDDSFTGVYNDANTFHGNGGDDSISGGGLADTAYGGSGADFIVGNAGDDELYGEAGEDYVIGGSGDDSLYGGTYDSVAGGLKYNDTEHDFLYGGSGEDGIIGLGGDMITGDAGDDGIYFDEGSDVSGGSGDDGLVSMSGGTGAESTIHGNSGDDILYELSDTGAAFYFYGDTGEDTIDYSQYASQDGTGVTIDLVYGLAYAGTGERDLVLLQRVEDATGTDFADKLTGDGGANVLLAGDGNDVVAGGAGADLLDGGAGLDILDYSTSSAGVILDLSYPLFRGGDAEGDRAIGFEKYVGSGFADRLSGGIGSDNLVGGGGADVMNGLKGDDTLDGGTGNDKISGSSGSDLLTGGAGADTFLYAYSTDASVFDEITDFRHNAHDILDFSALDADPAVAGNQTLTFIGTAAFDGGHGELRVDYSHAAYALVTVDLNGDKAADMTIYLDGVVASRPLVAADFML